MEYIILLLVCTLIPLGIGYGVSADIFCEWTNSNDWIGFWGNYAGAVLGGMISMIILKHTIKSDFNEKLLNELVEYHVYVQQTCNKMKNNEMIGEEKRTELTIKSELIRIKINASHNRYKNQMLKGFDKVIQKINELIAFKNNHNLNEPCDEIYKEIDEYLEQFIEDIELYYSKNKNMFKFNK